MNRLPLVIGLAVTLFMTIQAKPLNEYITSTAFKSAAGIEFNTATYAPQGLDTAIEVHQGGQDGGGSLW
jgi:hypothetical protein